jgi:hypothetical protein
MYGGSLDADTIHRVTGSRGILAGSEEARVEEAP